MCTGEYTVKFLWEPTFRNGILEFKSNHLFRSFIVHHQIEITICTDFYSCEQSQRAISSSITNTACIRQFIFTFIECVVVVV